MHDQEYRPGAPAPSTGHYEELNVFGNPTGKSVHADEGSTLPAAPRGFSWRLVGRDGLVEPRPSTRSKKPRRAGPGQSGGKQDAERHRAGGLNDSSAWEPTMSQTK